MQAQYQIQLTGEFMPDANHEQAQLEFGKLFKLDAGKVQQIFSKTPLVIKKGVDEQSGRKYIDRLEGLGLVAQLLNAEGELVGNDSISTPETKPTADTVKPKPPIEDPFADSMTAAAATQVEAGSESNGHADAAGDSQAEHAPEVTQPGYAFTIEGQPDFAFLTVNIPADETLKVEASAMATMDTNIRIKTKFKGGLGRFLTGESIFINEATAEHGPGEIGIAPGPAGELAHVYLDDDIIYLQNSAFVASAMSVEVESKWQGLAKGFFSGENLFLIRCSGKGDLWFNTYGAMIEIDVNGDYVVDTGNIVAFTDGLEYNIRKVGGYKSLFFSGEGLVCRFSGQGKVWIQTRGPAAFVSWANIFRPAKKRN